MKDYIKREDATKALTETCDTACPYSKNQRFVMCASCRFDDALTIIEDLPSADVEKVIRCKECKYFNLNKWGKVNDIPLIVAHEICDFWGEGCKTDKDAYCSFAERRG